MADTTLYDWPSVDLADDEPGEPLFDLNHYGSDGTDPDACEVNETPGEDLVDYFYLQDPESPKRDHDVSYVVGVST